MLDYGPRCGIAACVHGALCVVEIVGSSEVHVVGKIIPEACNLGTLRLFDLNL